MLRIQVLPDINQTFWQKTSGYLYDRMPLIALKADAVTKALKCIHLHLQK
jgi:hypothetical protein